MKQPSGVGIQCVCCRRRGSVWLEVKPNRKRMSCKLVGAAFISPARAGGGDSEYDAITSDAGSGTGWDKKRPVVPSVNWTQKRTLPWLVSVRRCWVTSA